MLKDHNISSKHYLKDPSFLVMVLIFEIFSIYLVFLSYLSIDWRIQWTSASLIAKGIPLYEQARYSIPSEKLILPPHHFPAFFYLLAIIASFGSEVLGKLFLWAIFNIMVVLYFKILRPENTTEARLLLTLLFIHPAIIGIILFKTFDSLMILFVLLAYDAYNKKKMIRSGIYLSIATGIKFLPVIAMVVFGMTLLQDRQTKEIIRITTAYMSSIILQFVFYILYFDNFLSQTILWQSHRGDSSLTIWGHFFPVFYDSNWFVVFQLSVLFLTTLLLYLINTTSWRISLWETYSILMAMFIFVYRTHYGHYGFWFYSGLIFVYYSLFQEKKYQKFAILMSINLIYYVGIVMCLDQCFVAGTLNPIQQFAIWLVNLDLVVLAFTLLFIDKLNIRWVMRNPLKLLSELHW